jgi:50S ribosomal protein L16 3-hydroxylase
MLHDAGHVYVNGESWRAGGEDAALMRRLADHRRLERADVQAASAAARALLRSWCEAGWARSEGS